MLTEHEEDFLREMIKKEKLRVEIHNMSFEMEAYPPAHEKRIAMSGKHDEVRAKIKQQLIAMKDKLEEPKKEVVEEEVVTEE